MRVLEMKSIPEIRKSQPDATDGIVLCDLAELRDLAVKHCQGYMGPDNLKRVVDGLSGRNLDYVKAADKFLSRFDDMVFAGKGWRIDADVVGGFVNVPAFLADSPMCMRTRRRATREIAPLTLYLELTGSSGVSGPRFIERGAAILSLVRLLANTRPVELWTTTTYGATGRLQMVACRVSTAPLDLARAAFFLCDEANRTAGYQVNRAELGTYSHRGGSIGWAYGVPDLERRWAGEILSRTLNPGETMVYIPAVHLHDQMRDPAKWVRDMLAKYGAGLDE